MRRHLTIFLLAALVFTAFPFISKAQKDGKWYTAKVIKVDDKSIKGTLTAADEKGLYLAVGRRKTGDTLTNVSLKEIREIKLRRRDKVGTGGTIGFATGLAASIAANVALHTSEDDEKKYNAMLIVGGAIFTFTTSAIGGVLSNGYDEVIQIFGQNEEYLKQLPRLKKFIPASEPLN